MKLTVTKENLVSGLSTWSLVDLSKRKLMRIKEFTLRQEPTVQTEHNCMPAEKFSLPENMTSVLKRPIWYSDIDGNGHMNNARYGAFVIDSLPPEYQSKIFKDFRINYKQEAIQGQMIELLNNINEEEKKITVVGKQSDGICFEAELYW